MEIALITSTLDSLIKAAATPAASSLSDGTGDSAPLPPTSPFPETEPPPRLNPCSYNQCLSGHIWPAIMALAKCPGCTGAVLAVQNTNCPFCNEPTVRSVVRSDFLPRGGQVIARCSGQVGIGESLDIEMSRNGWQESEKSMKTFLQKESEERQCAS
jgi:hypothetical protein